MIETDSLKTIFNAVKTFVSAEVKDKLSKAESTFAKKDELFSGNYNDLENVPKFSDVAIDGEYTSLLNKPKAAVMLDMANEQRLRLYPQNNVDENTFNDVSCEVAPGQFIILKDVDNAILFHAYSIIFPTIYYHQIVYTDLKSYLGNDYKILKIDSTDALDGDGWVYIIAELENDDVVLLYSNNLSDFYMSDFNPTEHGYLSKYVCVKSINTRDDPVFVITKENRNYLWKSQCFYSHDMKTWYPSDVPIGDATESFVCLGRVQDEHSDEFFVMCLGESYGTNRRIVSSYDGITWKTHVLPNSDYANYIKVINGGLFGRYLALCRYGIYVSSDLDNWEHTGNYSTLRPLDAVCYEISDDEGLILYKTGDSTETRTLMLADLESSPKLLGANLISSFPAPRGQVYSAHLGEDGKLYTLVSLSGITLQEPNAYGIYDRIEASMAKYIKPYLDIPEDAPIDGKQYARQDGEWAEVQSGEGLSQEAKTALLNCFTHVAWADEHGQTYYDALAEALGMVKHLVSISAVFTQGEAVVYPSTALDELKTMLVVTAHYDDGTTETINDYILSGTLAEGTSTITATYNGKNATFNVDVTAEPPAPVLDYISAVYTQSGTVYETTALDSLKADLVVTAHLTDESTQIVDAADYTLSGTLAVGTSIVTATYQSKTTTFNANVSKTVVDTTVVVAKEHFRINGADTEQASEYNGITKVYDLNEPTTLLKFGGIIPFDLLPNQGFNNSTGNLVIYNDGAYVNYVSEYENNTVGRWAQDAAGTLAEYSEKQWNVQPYNQVRFTVNLAHLDDAYMYVYSTGQVLFAGRNTPYYGMANIDGTPAEAQS